MDSSGPLDLEAVAAKDDADLGRDLEAGTRFGAWEGGVGDEEPAAVGGSLAVLSVERADAAHPLASLGQTLGLVPGAPLGVADGGGEVLSRHDAPLVELTEGGDQTVVTARLLPAQLGGAPPLELCVDELRGEIAGRLEALVVERIGGELDEVVSIRLADVELDCGLSRTAAGVFSCLAMGRDGSPAGRE